MKNLLMVLVGGLLLTTLASANTLILPCGGDTSANGTGQPLLPSNPYSIVCPTMALPMGDGYSSIEVIAYDSFNQSDVFDYPASGNTVVSFIYASLFSGLNLPGGFTDTLTEVGTTGAAGSGQYQLGTLITSNFASWTGAVGTVSTSVVSGGFQGSQDPAGNGQSSVNYFVEYTYGTIPEPVTTSLVGGGLVLFGLLANKRRKKA